MPRHSVQRAPPSAYPSVLSGDPRDPAHAHAPDPPPFLSGGSACSPNPHFFGVRRPG